MEGATSISQLQRNPTGEQNTGIDSLLQNIEAAPLQQNTFVQQAQEPIAVPSEHQPLPPPVNTLPQNTVNQQNTSLPQQTHTPLPQVPTEHYPKKRVHFQPELNEEHTYQTVYEGYDWKQLGIKAVIISICLFLIQTMTGNSILQKLSIFMVSSLGHVNMYGKIIKSIIYSIVCVGGIYMIETKM